MTFISADRNVDLTSSSLLYPEELLNKIDTPELPPQRELQGQIRQQQLISYNVLSQ